MGWSYLPLVTHQLQTKLKLSNNRLFMTPPKTDEVEEMVEKRMKAFAHAIMTAAHENQEDDSTQYPKVSTHTLAREIKNLIPDFNYHGYIKWWGEERMRKRVGMLRQWLNEDRITNPERMVTNEQILYWLTEDERYLGDDKK